MRSSGSPMARITRSRWGSKRMRGACAARAPAPARPAVAGLRRRGCQRGSRTPGGVPRWRARAGAARAAVANRIATSRVQRPGPRSDAVALELLDQRRSRDAEPARGLGLVAAGLAQGVDEDRAL